MCSSFVHVEECPVVVHHMQVDNEALEPTAGSIKRSLDACLVGLGRLHDMVVEPRPDGSLIMFIRILLDLKIPKKTTGNKVFFIKLTEASVDVFVRVPDGQASEDDGLDQPLGAKELQGREHILVRVLGTAVDLDVPRRRISTVLHGPQSELVQKHVDREVGALLDGRIGPVDPEAETVGEGALQVLRDSVLELRRAWSAVGDRAVILTGTVDDGGHRPLWVPLDGFSHSLSVSDPLQHEQTRPMKDH